MTIAAFLAISAADALAMSMVALLSFALGMIVTIFWVMLRSGAERSPIEEELFEEEEESRSQSNMEAAGDPPAEASREQWEQDPDWWRK
jgi:hypothetical protein